MKRFWSILFLFLLILPLYIPTARASDLPIPRIVDNADLLLDTEIDALERQSEQIREDLGMDAVIVTVNSLDGRSAKSYADSYFDDHDYGVGSERSGILLLIDMDSRQWYISTSGAARSAVPDDCVDELFDAMADDLSGGRYYNAFRAYLQALSGRLENQSGGQPVIRDDDLYYDHTYHISRSFSIGDLLLPVVVGAFAGSIGLLILRGTMNTKRRKSSAGDYLRQGTYHLRVHRDLFLYNQITKVPRPKETSGGSHHSSGGGHSGGHGGGGGRF